MNNIKKFLFVLIILFSFVGTVFAEDIPVDQIQQPSLNINSSVDVPASCDVTDVNGTSHHYENSYLAICALQTAIDQGNISHIDFITYSGVEGLFVNSINNIGDPNSQYWALYQNNNYATSGLSMLPVSTGDIINLKLHDFSDNDIGDSVSITINSLISTPQPEIQHHSFGGSYITPVSKMPFDIKKALDFLSSAQKENGSFGEEIYTDWATLAFASSPIYQDQKEKIKKYFSENKFTGINLTDYERHAMALMALDLNPYENNGTNYIKKIIDSFDGIQFGDKEQINDDIFALIVLQNAGYSEKDEIVQKTINFIISKQLENGSWNDSVDITGASIESLANFKEIDPLLTSPLALGGKISSTLEKAEKYLKENQKENGSWENISSSSWALQGEIALGNEITQAEQEYFGENQDENGNIKTNDMNNKIWQTSYAVTSLSGKTWNQIMQKFPTPSLESDGVKTENVKINPLQKTISDSNQAKFIKKVKKYTLSLASDGVKNPIEQLPTKKQSWFRRLIGKIFGF